MKEKGFISFITPSNFVSNNYAVALRRFLLTNTLLNRLVFFDESVFEASVNNLVFLAQRDRPTSEHVVFSKGKIADRGLVIEERTGIKQNELVDMECLLIPPESDTSMQVLRKIERNGVALGALASVSFGMQLRDRNEFPDDVIEDPGDKSPLTPYHRPCYTGRDIRRYVVLFNGRYCYFNRVAKRGGCWDEEVHAAKEKILVRQVGAYPEAALDTNGYAVLNTAFMIVGRTGRGSGKFLLGILNSNVVRFYWVNRFKDDRKTFPKIKGEYLKLIPVPDATAEQQAPIVAYVDQILTAKRVNPSNDVSELEHEIDQKPPPDNATSGKSLALSG